MKRFLFVFLVIIIFIPYSGLCQTEMVRAKIEGVPDFYYDIVNLLSSNPELTHVNIYTGIIYDDLQFIKTDSNFVAKYEVAIIILDKDGDQVDGKLVQQKIAVNDFEETNSRKSVLYNQFDFEITPGEYEINISFTDSETRSSVQKKTTFVVRELYKNSLSMSDITFSDDIEIVDSQVKYVKPQIASHIKTGGTELYCYFEIYNRTNTDEIPEVSYKIRNFQRKVIEQQTYRGKNTGTIIPEYLKLDKANFTHGSYTMELEVAIGDNKASVQKSFNIQWIGVPSSVMDINMAIEQLKYIAKKNEVKKIKKAADEERLEKFKKFWEKRDPSPGTEKNELMEEYYRRIQYSNEKFSNFREGWKSDMGMIYIIFGPPNDIERHPFERGDKPYEVWTYYQINRQFVFQDETGFGDYRLLNPLWRDARIGNEIYYNQNLN